MDALKSSACFHTANVPHSLAFIPAFTTICIAVPHSPSQRSTSQDFNPRQENELKFETFFPAAILLISNYVTTALVWL